MNAFATLVADFAEKTGVEPGKLGADNFDVEADGVVVSAQYRAERDDCVIFSLPLEDAQPDGPMLRRALELAADGVGTDGHFLGIREGMFTLSAVLPLAGLSADDFGRRILMLAAASKRVADELSRASAEGDGSAADSAQDSKGGDFMWV